MTNKQNTQEWEKHLMNGKCFNFEEWDVENNSLTENEQQMVEVLTDKILPRHMEYFDWNLPFAQASIIALRPLLLAQRDAENENMMRECVEKIPHRMRKEDCSCHLSAPCRTCENENDYDIGQRDGYNQALKDTLSTLRTIGEKHGINLK